MGYQRGGGRGDWRGGNQATRPAPEPTGELIASMMREGYRDRPDQELRVTLDEFQGHSYLGLRLWDRGQGGAFFPSRKGVSIRLGEAAVVAAALLEGLDKAGGPPEPRSSRPNPRPSTSAPPRSGPPPHSDPNTPPWESAEGFDEFQDGGRS